MLINSKVQPALDDNSACQDHTNKEIKASEFNQTYQRLSLINKNLARL